MMPNYLVYFAMDGYEISTVVRAKDTDNALVLARQKLEGKGLALSDNTELIEI
jgi:hypothetical protein